MAHVFGLLQAFMPRLLHRCGVECFVTGNYSLPETLRLGQHVEKILKVCCAVLCCAVLCCAVLCCAVDSITCEISTGNASELKPCSCSENLGPMTLCLSELLCTLHHLLCHACSGTVCMTYSRMGVALKASLEWQATQTAQSTTTLYLSVASCCSV